MFENIAITFADILLNEINKIIDDTKTGEQKMSDFDYKSLSIDEQIKAFYEILERADRDYRNEIDNYYMSIIVEEMWEIASTYTEFQMFDLEYLTQKVKQCPDDHEYSARDLDRLYEVLSSLRYNLLKEHNIEIALFEH